MTHNSITPDRRQCLSWAAALIGTTAVVGVAHAAEKGTQGKTGVVKGLGPTGLSVRDIGKSAQFYAALGFTLGQKYDLPHSAAKASGATDPNARMAMQQIAWGATTVLLVQFDPPVVAAPNAGPSLQRGLTNLELVVDDVDRAASRIRELGGMVIEGSRSTLTDLGMPTLHMVLCRDLDGTMLALVHNEGE